MSPPRKRGSRFSSQNLGSRFCGNDGFFLKAAKLALMKKILGVVVFFVASAALAAEEPEIAYGKFHRAIASADLAEAMKYAPAARRTEMAAMSEAQKDAQIKMLSLMLPRAFTLMNKTVAPNGKTANLVGTGPGQPVIAGAAPEKMYGRVKMVSDSDERNVDEH